MSDMTTTERELWIRAGWCTADVLLSCPGTRCGNEHIGHADLTA